MKNLYKRQKKIINDIKKRRKYKDFGIERMLRLFCAYLQYVSLANLIRNIFGKTAITRKTAVEVYMVINTFLPLIFIWFNIWDCGFLIFIITYLLIETVIYLITLIILPPDIPKPISVRRNFISIFFNYLQLSFTFAVYYLNAGLVKTRTASLYFSLVTQTTVGYGDIEIQTSMQQKLIIIHIILSILFTYMFFAYYIPNINKEWDSDSGTCDKSQSGKTK